MDLQALSGAVSGAVANAVVAALNSSNSLQPNQTAIPQAHANHSVSQTNQAPVLQPQLNQVVASQPLQLQAQRSALEPRSSLPSFVRRRASASLSAVPKAKRGKQEAIRTWDKNIVCLPRDFLVPNTNAIPIPRAKKRHILGEYGLIGKVHLKSSMSEGEIMSEVRSTFAKPMGNNPFFPFKFLQSTGGGSKTLTIPAVSQSFLWTAAQVASLGQAHIYILAEATLDVPECDQFEDDDGDDDDRHTSVAQIAEQSTSSDSQNRAATVGPMIARSSGTRPSGSNGTGPSRRHSDAGSSNAGPSSSGVQYHASKTGSESAGPSRSSYREYCEMINLESDSDYEDLQAAIEASFDEAARMKQERAIPPLCLLPMGRPVKEMLKQHFEDVVRSGDDDTCQRINIRRSNLFDDTLTQMRKSSFDFAKPFSVRFLGEAAVDTGGPKRELFRLFLEEMKTRASLFHSSPVGLLPSHNVTALGSSDYFVIGTILAASILLGGPPPVCFTPAVSDVLVYGDVRRTPSVDCISDPSITDKLRKVLSATSDTELQEQFQSLDYSFRFDCGYSKPVSSITLETRTEFVRCISLHYLYSVYAEINQLRKGLLETLSFKQLADEHPMELWSLLAASNAEKLTAVQMQDLFRVHYSPRGSNARVLEENVIMHMYDFLQECEDSPQNTEVSLGDFLAFVSGTNQPPAIGFANTPSIHFTDGNRLPCVSTCAITITLPRNIQTYQPFKEMLQLAVLGSHGFGNV